jgi:Zn-dependent peptidase ImmA (M78 family)
MEYDASTTRLTDSDIEERAENFRLMLGLSPDERFNIVDILSSKVSQVVDAFRLEIAAADVPQDVEAFTAFNPPRIVVRQDVHDLARADNPRYRLTLAHELGHLVLHSDGIFPRSEMPDQRQKSIPAKESTEGQAFRFGACLLMPRVLIAKYPKAEVLARECRVSFTAAQARINDVERQQQREKIMQGFQELLAILKSTE